MGTVLVVEDDEQLATFMEDVLSEEGYAVRVAGSGTEGLGSAGIAEVQLVIFDNRMSDMDGSQFYAGCASSRRPCRR